MKLLPLIPLLLMSLSHAAPPELVPFKDVEAYYQLVSKGTIAASPGVSEKLKNLKLLKSKDYPYQFRLTPEFDPELTASAFTWDVEGFLKLMGANDLTSAKRTFYENQNFYPSVQAHRQPYYYLEDWGQLFHPPIRELKLPLEKYFPPFASDYDSSKQGSQFFNPGFQISLDKETGTELTFENDVELLSNNAAFAQKLALVRAAKKTLWVSIMFLACDETGIQLVKAMIEKKKQGVDVRVLTEGFYADTFGRACAGRLTDLGIPVEHVNDSMRLSTLGSAMHQKIWLRDGEEAIIGGMNILDYENESDGFNHMNRDGDLWVKSGPIVTDAMSAFVHLWLLTVHNYGFEKVPITQFTGMIYKKRQNEKWSGLRGQENYLKRLSDVSTRMKGVCRFAAQSFQPKLYQPIAPIIEKHLAYSRKQVILTTPDVTFNPRDPANSGAAGSRIASIMRLLYKGDHSYDPQVYVISNGLDGGAGEVSIWAKNRMREASASGSGFKMAWSKALYNYMTGPAAKSNREKLRSLQANPKLKAFTYFNYIHAKHYLFDRLATFVGSWNLDHNSADINHEAGVICLDEKLRLQMEAQLTLDIANSLPVVSNNGE